MAEEQLCRVMIEVDGGVGLHNATALLQAGADILVAGSSIFGTADPRSVIQKFKTLGAERQNF